MKMINKFSNKWFAVLMILFVTAISVIRSSFLPEMDILWGARNGGDLLNNGLQVFLKDEWNLQTLGEGWSPNSWLWNVLLYVSYNSFGILGFFVITFIANWLAYFFFWLTLKKLGLPKIWQFAVLFGIWVIIIQFMNGRSNTVDVLILAVFLYVALLIKSITNQRYRLLGYFGVAFLVTFAWINLHLTAVIAVVLLPAVIYVYSYTEKLRFRIVSAVVTGVGVVLALPLSPFGVQGLVKVSQVQNESKDFFVEWSNVFATDDPNWPVLMLIVLSILLMVFAFKKKQFVLIAGLLSLSYLSYDTIRFTPFLLVFAVASLSVVPYWPLPYEKWLNSLVVVLVAVFVILASITGVKLAINPGSVIPIDPNSYNNIPKNAHVATTQDNGSALILFRPDVKVTIDGRNDLIGKAGFIEATNVLYTDNKTQLADWLKRLNVDTVFVPDRNSRDYENLIQNLTDLGWSEVSNSGTYIIENQN